MPLKWADFESKVRAFFAGAKTVQPEQVQAAAPQSEPEAEPSAVTADETIVAMLKTGFANSRNVAELDSFGALAKKAHIAGEFGDDVRKELGAIYMQRKRELPEATEATEAAQ
jgi:hypothetical protein